MKKTRFTEAQIIGILKEQEQGLKVADICRKHGISDATFYHSTPLLSKAMSCDSELSIGPGLIPKAANISDWAVFFTSEKALSCSTSTLLEAFPDVLEY